MAPSKNNGSVSYGLDPVGNRLSEVSSLGGVSSGSWIFNADDELSSETYDADGNVTSTGGKAFSYDSQNERKRVFQLSITHNSARRWSSY